jgi:hypothetical protein
MKLKWALVIEKLANLSLEGNPGGFKLGPTPKEFQAWLEKERERVAQDKHRRQVQIELGLQRDFLQRIPRERGDECRDKEAKVEQAR